MRLAAINISTPTASNNNTDGEDSKLTDSSITDPTNVNDVEANRGDIIESVNSTNVNDDIERVDVTDVIESVNGTNYSHGGEEFKDISVSDFSISNR